LLRKTNIQEWRIIKDLYKFEWGRNIMRAYKSRDLAKIGFVKMFRFVQKNIMYNITIVK
jgi:hypothetical protein